MQFSCSREICHPIILLLCVEVEESSFLIQRHVIGCLSRCGTRDLILLVEIGKSQKKKRRSGNKGKTRKGNFFETSPVSNCHAQVNGLIIISTWDGISSGYC